MRSSTRSLLILIAAASVIAIFLVIFFDARSRSSDPSHPPTQVSLRFNWIDQPIFVGYYLAKDKGFYADAGLDVTFKPYVDGLDQTVEAADGLSDFTLSSAFEVLSTLNAGHDVKAVAAIFQQLPEAYASLKTTGIRSPSDFKGKMLGVKVGNPSTRIIYQSLMGRYGLAPQDATFKDLDYSQDVAEDLTLHKADIVNLYRNDEGFTLEQKGVSYDLMLPENFGVVSYGDIITTSGSLIDRDPETVRAFVEASIRGWEYAIAHPDEALRVMRDHESARYKDPAYERYIFRNSLPLIVPTGSQRIGSMSFAVWKSTAVMMMQAGAIKGDLPLTDAYTNRFLKK